MAIYSGGANSSYYMRKNANSGTVLVSGDASTYYPVIFGRVWNGEIVIEKLVHNYATWDGHLQFRYETHPYGWGSYLNVGFIRQYQYSSRHFIHSVGSTPSAGNYIYVYLLGGGRSYGWYTNGAVESGGLVGGPYYSNTEITNNGTWGPTTASSVMTAKGIS